MPNYKRLRINGATYFFTVNLAHRGKDHLVTHIDALRVAYRLTQNEHPFHCDAMVVLPDHIHAIWTLPATDSDYSVRWRKIKARFSHAVGFKLPRSSSKQAKRETGIWQRRFWEHMIRDDDDYATHMIYCRDNPLKHQLVTDPLDWPYSSFAKRRVGNLPTLPLPPLHATAHPAASHGTAP